MNQQFNITSLIVLGIILAAGLGLIWFFNWKEERRLKKKMQDQYPSVKKRYSKIVDAKLDQDITERFYHNN